MDRIEIVRRREQIWLEVKAREDILNELEHIGNSPTRQRQRSLAIISTGNGGKTSLALQYIQRHPRRYVEGQLIVPAIYLSMGNIKQVEELSIELLKQLDLPDAHKGTHYQRTERFLTMSKRVALGLVFLDEFHDCVNTSGRGEPFLRFIKDLMNKHICVVPMGVPELADVIASDDQFQSRFNYLRGSVPKIESLSQVKALMLHISGFEDRDILDDAVKYVLKESRGAIGNILDIIEECLIHAGDLTIRSLQRERARMDQLDNLSDRIVKVRSISK